MYKHPRPQNVALNSAPTGRSTYNRLSGRYQQLPADPRPTTLYSINETCFINSVATIFNERRLKILPLLSTSQIIRQSPRPFVTLFQILVFMVRGFHPHINPKATAPLLIGKRRPFIRNRCSQPSISNSTTPHDLL